VGCALVQSVAAGQSGVIVSTANHHTKRKPLTVASTRLTPCGNGE